MDPREVNAHARKMFYPISHGNIFADFPGFLRAMAEAHQQAIAGMTGGGTPESAPATDAARRPGVARGGCKCV